MQIAIKTTAKGFHNVKINGNPIITFTPDGSTKLAGRDISFGERTAVVAAISAHKAICWTKARCVGHDVTL